MHLVAKISKNLGHLEEAFEMMDMNKGEAPRCTLITTTFDYCVQGVLGILALASLWIKFRIFDTKIRSLHTWALDTSKQALGGCLVHFVNIGMSKALHEYIQEESLQADECDFYLINLALDTIVGLALIYIMFELYETIVHNVFHLNVAEMGDYGDPPKYSVWAFQLFVYMAVILSTKLCIFMVELWFVREFDKIGHVLLYPLDLMPRIKLVVVMVIAPLVLTSVQFWAIDNWMMYVNGSHAESEQECSAEREALKTQNIEEGEQTKKGITEYAVNEKQAFLVADCEKIKQNDC